MNIIEISDINDEALRPYASMTEPELRHIYEPAAGVFVAESPKVILRALMAGYEPVSVLAGREYLKGEAEEVLEKAGEIPVYVGEESLLKNITGFQLTRGILCCMRRRLLLSPEILLKEARRVAVLENVMNPTNTGAIFRSAAALGIDAVLLTPGSADPLYRRAARVSMGTVFQVPWTYFGAEDSEKTWQERLNEKETPVWPDRGMALLHAYGFKTAAMALSDISVPVSDPSVRGEEKLAIILGTEGDGLSEKTIAGCDYTVKIPMYRGVDSLNVAAASAVAFYALCGR